MNDQGWLPGTLLGRLDESARGKLMAAGVQRTVPRSHVILREGTTGSHVVLLERAFAKVTATTPDGREALLAIRLSGDVVGEMSALNGVPRSATVTACRTSSIRTIQLGEFRSFLRDHPDAAMELAGVVADRLRWANRRRVDFASCAVKVRIARVLWEIAVKYGRVERRGTVVQVHLTQAELGTLCGAAEVTAQKALRELRAAGIVQTGYREYVVRHMDELRAAAQLDDR